MVIDGESVRAKFQSSASRKWGRDELRATWHLSTQHQVSVLCFEDVGVATRSSRASSKAQRVSVLWFEDVGVATHVPSFARPSFISFSPLVRGCRGRDLQVKIYMRTTLQFQSSGSRMSGSRRMVCVWWMPACCCFSPLVRGCRGRDKSTLKSLTQRIYVSVLWFEDVGVATSIYSLKKMLMVFQSSGSRMSGSRPHHTSTLELARQVSVLWFEDVGVATHLHTDLPEGCIFDVSVLWFEDVGVATYCGRWRYGA